MITLNLKTENFEQERIKGFLEKKVSEVLAEKINNGVCITKDGKRLLNKKDLNGFWKYATEEARKIAAKGSNSTYVNDDTVFGWAIHYFEEDTIEGRLYNEDGSEFKPVKGKTEQSSKTIAKTPKKAEKPPQMQFSLFDLSTEEDKDKNMVEEVVSDDDKDEPSEEEIQEAFEEIRKEKPKGSPVYVKYMEIQKQYPDCIIAYRLGDFYEIFGKNAKLVADKLDLTLTGRNFGLEERVPMVGFPYHCADIYIGKIINFAKVAIVEQSDVEVKERKKLVKVDYETGEVFDLPEEMSEFDSVIYEPNDADIEDNNEDELEKTAKSIDKEIMITLYNLLDGKMNIR